MKRLLALLIAVGVILVSCSTVPPQVLTGKLLKDVGLTAELPEDVKLYDTNYSGEQGRVNIILYICGYEFKRPLEGYESFGIIETVNVPINHISIKGLNVLSLEAFEWDEGTAKNNRYIISGVAENPEKTYDEIKPYIIYEDKHRIVVDTSTFLGVDFRTQMEEYIEENKDNIPVKDANGEYVFKQPYATGSYIYDYSWLPAACDLVIENKDRLIVPIEE